MNSYFIKLTKTATGGVLYKSCTQKFCNNHRKTPMLEHRYKKRKIVWKHGPKRSFFLYNLSSENY